MLVAISIKFAQDNRDKTLDDPLYVSGALWFMLLAGYVMPFAGILSFFIATFYWVYEYPNGICINLLSILEVGGIDNVLFPNESTKELKEKTEQISTQLMDKPKLTEDFKTLAARTFSTKLFYPFRSPPLVLVCILYGAMQFAFVLVSIVSIQANGGVIFYYFFTVILGLIANAYVFAVGALWVAIIIGVLLLIALIVFAFVLLIILLSCGGSSRQQRRNY